MLGMKKLLRLIEVQMWMRMFVWENSIDQDQDFQWYLVEASLDVAPEHPKPRERMINNLRSLAQLGLTHDKLSHSADSRGGSARFSEWNLLL